jgi:hypothetical protein
VLILLARAFLMREKPVQEAASRDDITESA